jgi:Domain of unknown function (DUF4267)
VADDGRLRGLVAALGLGSIAFGMLPVVAPRHFGRMFGIEGAEAAHVAAVFRSVGARDVAVGVGLLSAATRGASLAPWLLARLICDGTDAVACALAIGEGARGARFLGLTALAAAAAGGGAMLYRAARVSAAE